MAEACEEMSGNGDFEDSSGIIYGGWWLVTYNLHNFGFCIFFNLWMKHKFFVARSKTISSRPRFKNQEFQARLMLNLLDSPLELPECASTSFGVMLCIEYCIQAIKNCISLKSIFKKKLQSWQNNYEWGMQQQKYVSWCLTNSVQQLYAANWKTVAA